MCTAEALPNLVYFLSTQTLRTCGLQTQQIISRCSIHPRGKIAVWGGILNIVPTRTAPWVVSMYLDRARYAMGRGTTVTRTTVTRSRSEGIKTAYTLLKLCVGHAWHTCWVENNNRIPTCVFCGAHLQREGGMRRACIGVVDMRIKKLYGRVASPQRVRGRSTRRRYK